jgi:hypothetical protein
MAFAGVALKRVFRWSGQQLGPSFFKLLTSGDAGDAISESSSALRLPTR